MNRTSPSSEGNSAVQVKGPPRICVINCGTLSCYMCCPVLTRWIPTCSKFLHNPFVSHWCRTCTITILHATPLFLNDAVNFTTNSGVDQGNQPCTKVRPFSHRVRVMEGPISFLGSNRKDFSNLARTLSFTLQVDGMCW